MRRVTEKGVAGAPAADWRGGVGPRVMRGVVSREKLLRLRRS